MNKTKACEVCIIGGGNIGSLLAVELSEKKYQVTVITSQSLRWGQLFEAYDSSDKLLHVGKIKQVTSSFEVIANADIILVTYPAERFEFLAKEIKPYIKKSQWLGFIPGSGQINSFLDFGCTVFGFQRTHDIARTKELGKSVYSLGRKSELYIASIPVEKNIEICTWVEEALGMPCFPLKDYLVVTLTPSNPILHTCRLYCLFNDYKIGVVYERQFHFYKEWDDQTSELLFRCDKELQQLCKAIPKDLSEVISLRSHYGVNTEVELTEKIRSIPAFQNILAPMKKIEGGFVPDFENRYFATDFPQGLKIILDVALTHKMDVPSLQMLWEWYVSITIST